MPAIRESARRPRHERSSRSRPRGRADRVSPEWRSRVGMVEIKGERVLAPSCCRKPAAGMEVTSDSPRAVHSQKIIVEMLAADVPVRVYKLDSELEQWKRWLGLGAPRFAARAQPKADLSHPAIAVNL